MGSSFQKRMPSATRARNNNNDKLEKIGISAGNSSINAATEMSSRKSTAVSSTSRIGSGSAVNKRNSTTMNGGLLSS